MKRVILCFLGLNVDPSPPSASQSINQYPSLTALSSVETVTQWLGRNRYGHLLQNFRNYDGRDLLRLSKDDLVSVCGLSEGIRLYNDLHLTPVAPRMTLYIGTKEGQVRYLNCNRFSVFQSQCFNIYR